MISNECKTTHLDCHLEIDQWCGQDLLELVHKLQGDLLSSAVGHNGMVGVCCVYLGAMLGSERTPGHPCMSDDELSIKT